VPLLRTTRLVAALLVLAPVAAEAAPLSRKPPPIPAVSKDPRHDPAKKPEPAKPAPKAASSTLKNTAASTPAARPARGSTASLGAPAGPQRTLPGRSVGSPTEGHLIGGAHLADAPYLRVYPSYASGDVRWGVEPLVSLIDRAARSVRKQYPDAVLSVGHLSRAGGGELDRHASHESGRDADIGFYVKNIAGKPVIGDQMVPFVGDGSAPTWPGARFDDARNWALVAAIVGDAQARVTHIFVATPIRERLLAYAAKVGAPSALRTRASEVLAQPRGALPHDDHFHVRIGCPPGMEKCIEQPTARRHSVGHGAAVAAGHPAHPTHGATAGLAARAPVPAPAPAAPPPAKPAPRAVDPHKEESAASDSVPNLSPEIPGLDSAVIPSPLTGVKSTWGTAKDVPPATTPSAAPISDPDGILQ
jgi:penicillin-insensitive murein endopeptidase